MTEPGADALRSHVDKWLDVQPYQRVALVFVDPQRFPGHVALAALEQELLSAAYGVREPQVAAVKLNWWAEELAGAPDSGGRHPLTKALFADARARAIPSALWVAPASAAVEQLEQGTAADFAAQLRAAEPLHHALAALETAWWFGANADPARAGQLAVLAHLLHALRRLEDDAQRDRLALPMARMARHGLDRSQLRSSGAPRGQAVAGQLEDLVHAWTRARQQPGPLSVFRALESRHGQRLLRRARASPTPLAVLQREQQPGTLALTLAAWRAAQRWQRQSR